MKSDYDLVVIGSGNAGQAAAEVLDSISRAPTHRIRIGKPKLDWKRLIARKQTFVAGVPEAFEKSLKQRGIDVLHGRARFVGPREVAVGGRRFSARKILVSNGSKPRRLPIPGAESVITSDDILEMKRLPRSLVFIGAGVIGLEFTHVFARASARVTILEVTPRPLPALDPDTLTQRCCEPMSLS
jgi:glutathione reductase (NADPH)